jgi:hypothetical protein
MRECPAWWLAAARKTFYLCSRTLRFVKPAGPAAKITRARWTKPANHRATDTLARAERAIDELGRGEPFLIVDHGSDGSGGWQTHAHHASSFWSGHLEGADAHAPRASGAGTETRDGFRQRLHPAVRVKARSHQVAGQRRLSACYGSRGQGIDARDRVAGRSRAGGKPASCDTPSTPAAALRLCA